MLPSPRVVFPKQTKKSFVISMDNMDSSTAAHNWLAFPLSNQHHHHSSSYLFDHFSTTHQDGVDGPKLEDFLGGCTEPLARYSSGADVAAAEVDRSGCGMYVDDVSSDLKSVAAGFLLRGSPAEADDARKALVPAAAADARKAVDTFGQRTSIYRGVTRHRWTGRYEAHLWDNSCRREGQSRKGRQVYLGGYDKEEKAARAYDLAALKYWGPTTTTNFPVGNYEKELEEMKNMTRQEFVASLRRKSSGFSRGASMYRGVTRHHQHGRWQARIGRVAGNKDLYLGTFSTQEEAAEAYDIAAIKFRGLNAVTNFDMSRYDVKSIANSSLPIGGMSSRTSKATETSSSEAITIDMNHQVDGQDSSSFGFSVLPMKSADQEYWSLLALHQQQQQLVNNHQSLGFGLFPSGVNMDFSAPTAPMNQGLVWNNGIWQQEQQPDQQSQSSTTTSSSSIPYATPVDGYASANYDGSSYVGSWAAPPAQTYYHQAAKPNVGLYQTPICGME